MNERAEKYFSVFSCIFQFCFSSSYEILEYFLVFLGIVVYIVQQNFARRIFILLSCFVVENLIMAEQY